MNYEVRRDTLIAEYTKLDAQVKEGLVRLRRLEGAICVLDELIAERNKDQERQC